MPRHHRNISPPSASFNSVVGCAALLEEGAWFALGFDYSEMLLRGVKKKRCWEWLIHGTIGLQSYHAAVGPLSDLQGLNVSSYRTPGHSRNNRSLKWRRNRRGRKGSSSVAGPSDCVVTNWLHKRRFPQREVIVWELQGKKMGFV